MKFDVITIFPKIFESYLNESIIRRAQKNGKININIIDLRKFSTDKHNKVDDKPFGGGPGMVFKIEPLAKALYSILKRKNNLKRKTNQTLIPAAAGIKVVLFSVAGKQFDSKMATELSKKYDHIIMIAGHYEGVDDRIKKIIQNLGFNFGEISIGPYVLTGGELPAMVVIDAVSRHITGVLGKNESLEEKRFGVGVPVYTRPEVFKWSSPGRGKRDKKYAVPKVLLSGNHKKIAAWREARQSSLAHNGREEWRKKHQKTI